MEYRSLGSDVNRSGMRIDPFYLEWIRLTGYSMRFRKVEAFPVPAGFGVR